MDALPTLLKDCANAVAERHEADKTLSAHNVLAAANTGVFPHYDVRQLSGNRCPTALFMLALAYSGERKSTVDDERLSPLKALMDAAWRQYHDQKDFFDRATKWQEDEYKQLAKDHRPWADRQQEFDRLKSEAPPTPLLPHYETENFTIEGYFKILQEGRGHLSIHTSEGMLGGHAFTNEAKLRSISGLVNMYDGRDITRDRVSEHERLTGRRGNLNIAVQPRIASDFLCDEIFRRQGFINRLLLANIETVLGRKYPKIDPSSPSAVTAFHARLRGATGSNTKNEGGHPQ